METMNYEQAYTHLVYVVQDVIGWADSVVADRLTDVLDECVAGLRAAQPVRHAEGDRVVRRADGAAGVVTSVFDSPTDPGSDAVGVQFDDPKIGSCGGAHSAFDRESQDEILAAWQRGDDAPQDAVVHHLVATGQTANRDTARTLARSGNVVVNLSDLSRPMTDALVGPLSPLGDGDPELCPQVITLRNLSTLNALIGRGLVVRAGRINQRYGTLTEAGERARAELLGEQDDATTDDQPVECRTGLCDCHEGGRPTSDATVLVENETPNAATNGSEALYKAVGRVLPMATELARYVAQLRRWAQDYNAGSDWDRGRSSAYTMVADQLERDMLRDLAPLLRDEAARRYHDQED
jgi:hypothetical protein